MPNVNVYELITLYYEQLPKASHAVLPKDTAERFLRKLAWSGETDSELKRQWCILQLLAENAIAWDLPTWEYFSLTDYQELFYQFAEKEPDMAVDEESLAYFFASLVHFGAFCAGKDSAPLLDYLQTARDSFYVLGKFLPPARRNEDEFYSSLEHKDTISPEDMDRLNGILDQLLNTLGEYFHQSEFFLDLTRAVMMYGGPDFDPNAEVDPEERDDFYFSFWDFFLFDYHLVESDMTPLAYYYKRQRKKLRFTEDSIIRDLLGAKFTVFSVESMDEDVVICRDLFTDNIMELPMPDTLFADFSKLIFIGHVHNNGMLLLNYVTTVSASKKLRERMKHEVLRQYNWFVCQKPRATLEDFFAREAASVRQIIRILTEYAQLNVVPMKECPKPVQETASLPRAFHPARARLKQIARSVGFSAYAVSLLSKLYADYVLLSQEPEEQKKTDDTLAAALCIFGKVNGMGSAEMKEFIQRFHTSHIKVRPAAAAMQKLLACVPFDPRYLTEEGFVQALYME